MDSATGKLETPVSGNDARVIEPMIRVMPQEFRGGKTPMSAPVVIKPAEPATPPVPVPAPKMAPRPVQKRRVPPALFVGGGVFLSVLVVAGVLLFTLRTPEPEPTNEPPVQVNLPPTNTPVQTPPVNTPQTNTQVPVVTVPEPGKDSDSDGLTDIEEILYGSDARVPDTDGDTYLDGNEVFYRYNPRGTAPSGLDDAGYVRPFKETGYDYGLYYPSRWTLQLIGGQTQGAVFRAPTGESVRVVKSAKAASQSVAEWYAKEYPGESMDTWSQLTTRQGLVGLLSGDKLTSYLDAQTAVYVITYTLADAKYIEFLTTYQMMVNSFNVVIP